jgi:hypothetical protein
VSVSGRIRERWRRARGPLGLADPGADTLGRLGLATMVESPSARLLILPADPEASALEFDGGFWKWWEAEQPDPAMRGSGRWGTNTRSCSFAALRFDDRGGSPWWHCVALHKSGALDVTVGREVAFEIGNPPRRAFRLSQVVARVWAMLALYRMAVDRYALSGPYEVTFALIGTRGAMLCGFGRDWAEPHGIHGEFGHCFETNLLLHRELAAWPDEAGVRSLAFSIGGCIEDAWGVRERRFLFRQGPQTGEFDPNSYQPR